MSPPRLEAFVAPRTVLVCGSRDWGEYYVIQHYLRQLPRVVRAPVEQIRITHGAASRVADGVERSADALAATVAEAMGYLVQSFPTDWYPHDVFDPTTGYRRNLQMLDQRPCLVLAFQRGRSRGTQHTIDEARRRGITVEVYRPTR